MVDTNRSLVLEVCFISNVQVVIRIHAAGHHHVGHRRYLQKEGLQSTIDAIRGNLIVRKLRSRVWEIARVGRVSWIIVRVLSCRGGIVDFDAAHAEITLELSLGRDSEDLCIRLR